MKKLFPALPAIVILFLVFYSCNLCKPGGNVNFNDYPCSNDYTCSNYRDAPVNEMDKNDVLNMISNYYSNQYAAINSGTFSFNGGIPSTTTIKTDSRAVFFSLDSLKRLIYYIEKSSCNFSDVDKQNLGVNIYFASYPAQMQMQKHGYDYTNRHTLIFLPSVFDNGSSIARDFDPRMTLGGISGVNGTSPFYLTDSFLSTTPTIMGLGTFIMPPPTTTTTVSPSTGTMSSQNHGTAIPPPPTPTGNIILEKTDPQ